VLAYLAAQAAPSRYGAGEANGRGLPRQGAPAGAGARAGHPAIGRQGPDGAVLAEDVLTAATAGKGEVSASAGTIAAVQTEPAGQPTGMSRRPPAPHRRCR